MSENLSYVTESNLATAASEWLEKISSVNIHQMTLDAANSALLVIDMQKFFLDPQSPSFTCGGTAIIPNIKRLIEVFRAANRPVIYTCHVHHPDGLDAGILEWWWKGMCIEGTPESEVCDELAPLEGEKVIYKHRYSAFYNTDLETVLRCLNVKDIVVTGVMTNICCETTARDAFLRDYRVFFAADATGSCSEDLHVASLLNLAFGFAYVVKADDMVNAMEK
jgi:nicotinamidase-related amidase